MRLKIGFLALICLLFNLSVSAQEDTLEEKMRQLSVDVPKQQAELDTRLTEAQEEIARLKQQLLAAQEQVAKLEAGQIESKAQIEELNKNFGYLQREVQRLSLSPGTVSQGNDPKLIELNTDFNNFKRALIRNTAIALPILLGLGIFF